MQQVEYMVTTITEPAKVIQIVHKLSPESPIWPGGISSRRRRRRRRGRYINTAAYESHQIM